MSHRSACEGSITQRKDKRWQAALQVNGQRTTVYGKTRSEAAAKLRQLQCRAPARVVQPSWGKQTLNDLLDAWLGVKTPNLKPRTLADYRAICDDYLRPALGKEPLGRISPARIQQLYADWQRQGKARTALKIHQVLSQALALAVRWDWLAANPCDRTERPRYRAQRKALWTPQQLRAFLDGSRDHWLYPCWHLAVSTGCRLGELLALTWEDVDLVARTVRITKATQRIHGHETITTPKSQSSVRVISLPAEAVEVLGRQAAWRLARGGGSAVFSGYRGEALAAATVEAALRRACARLSLPRITPHGLRHLHASILLCQGLSVPEVSKRLGHASPAITMSVYAHDLNQDDAQATDAIARVLTGRAARL